MEKPMIIEQIKKALNEGNYRYDSQNGVTIYILGDAPDRPGMVITLKWQVAEALLIKEQS